MKHNPFRQFVFFFAGVLMIFAIFRFNMNRVKALRPEGENVSSGLNQIDLASLKNSKIKRATELGQAVPQKNPTVAKDKLDVLLNDPSVEAQYHLANIHAQKAWTRDRALGSRKVKVCVIDTGVDVNHPDLKANLWVNPGETGKDKYGQDKATNQVDDDLDGCVDDVHGCNLITGTGDITDHHGHGTHVAGIIGATGDHGLGVVGVSPRVTLIIAKYYDPYSPSANNLLNTVKSIHYCVAHHADIINYSGGGLEPSPQERAAIEEARQHGILFVAAAGNEESDSDYHHYYPANYGLDNIISVTAYDRNDKVLPSSNYGARTVDIAAPGKNIFSTLPGGQYGYLTGTSQATAVVTGVAALIKSQYPDFDATRLIRHLTETGDLDPIRLAGKTRYEKRLNAYRALSILGSGESVTGTVARNAANLNPDQFALSHNASPNISLMEFNSDLRNFLRERAHQGISPNLHAE